VITGQEAERIARDILGRPADDADRPWRLQEFEQGWLIYEESPPDDEMIGEACRVIERESGHVLLFSSGVPTERILNEYAAIQDQGLVENV
jgi:hypothetical protein